jgi:hypothetical protein
MEILTEKMDNVLQNVFVDFYKKGIRISPKK